MSFAFDTFNTSSLSPESSHLSCMLLIFPFNMLIIVKVPDSCNIWVILESGSINYFIPWQFFSWIFVWFIILHYVLNMSRRTENLRQIPFMLENGHIYSSFRPSVCVSEWQRVEVKSVNQELRWVLVLLLLWLPLVHHRPQWMAAVTMCLEWSLGCQREYLSINVLPSVFTCPCTPAP